MAEYEQSMTVQASSDAVFDFVSDIRNLPKYLPTTKSAQSQGQERVRVQGEAAGMQYDADGFLRADRENHRLEWGADEQYYSGYLDINPQGDNTSNVTVHIAFRSPPDRDGTGDGPSESDIQEGLRKALESIQNYVTGQGEKVEPRAAT